MTDPKALRISDGFGVALTPLDVCRRELDDWAIGGRSVVKVIDETHDFARVAAFLSHVTHPATRHVMIPLRGATIFNNNVRNGPGFADHVKPVSMRLHARVALVRDVPARVWSDAVQRERLTYEARILEVRHDGDLLRSVACMDDGGRWILESHGDRLPVEAGFNATARRKRDRFTSADLRTLVAAYGLPFPEPDDFTQAGEYVLLHERYQPVEWERSIEARACTPEQRDDPAFGYYQRGLGWVPHIDTHASSVIADFERAVRINPTYEPLVAEHLERARAIVV